MRNKILNLGFINYIFASKIKNGEDVDTLIYDLGIYLLSYDDINGTSYYEDYYEYYSSFSENYVDIVATTNTGNTYTGTIGDDVYCGHKSF